MTKIKYVFILQLFMFSFASAQEIIAIETNDISIVYRAEQGGKLFFLYYGQKLKNASELSLFKYPNRPDTQRDFAPEGYPAFGHGNVHEPALKATHFDGNLTTSLVFIGFDKKEIDSNITQITIKLKDPAYPFFVDLYFKAYKKENVIAQWAQIQHQEKSNVSLSAFYSSFFPIANRPVYLTHFHGMWAGEMKLEETKLTHGIKTIESKKGVRTTQTENPAFLLSLDMSSQEDIGEVYAGALAWSGNYKLVFEMDEKKTLNVLSGINPFASEYYLKKGEVFKTPEMLLTYSNSGRGQISRNLHEWGRKYGMANGDKIRPIVLNSWEGAYFSFNENILTQMMDDAAEIGVEMFVLDDGWFGNKYPRNSSRAGLGDWQVNENKLPRGLGYLADYAESKGIKFGIWVEPEMANPQSELAEKHPDWIVKSQNREPLTWRGQWLLDLSNPKVQDFVFSSVDKVLASTPKIAYVKWDANRHVEDVGSTFLSQGTLSHFYIEYTKGLYHVYERIRQKYPNIIFQVCASGGGRVDYGSLKYHDEFWASDNTDAFERIFIHYSTNLFYPPLATAAHVSTSPNHQTQRITPLKFRFDVAMTGRMGLELQPKDLQGKDREFAMEAIKNYKALRETIQLGNLYRIQSPYEEGGYASWMYLNRNNREAALFAFSLENHTRGIFPTIKLKGLDPNKQYKVEEINKSRGFFWGDGKIFSGEYLMNVGMNITISRPYDSAVFRVTEI